MSAELLTTDMPAVSELIVRQWDERRYDFFVFASLLRLFVFFGCGHKPRDLLTSLTSYIYLYPYKEIIRILYK